MSVLQHMFCKSYFNVGLLAANFYYPLNVSDDFGIGIVKVGSNEVCLSNYI